MMTPSPLARNYPLAYYVAMRFGGMGDGKMKMAVVASVLLVSVQTASAQYYNPYGPSNFYYQYYWGAPAAEDGLAYTKALRDKARKEREETGKSDVGARLCRPSALVGQNELIA